VERRWTPSKAWHGQQQPARRACRPSITVRRVRHRGGVSTALSGGRQWRRAASSGGGQLWRRPAVAAASCGGGQQWRRAAAPYASASSRLSQQCNNMHMLRCAARGAVLRGAALCCAVLHAVGACRSRVLQRGVWRAARMGVRVRRGVCDSAAAGSSQTKWGGGRGKERACGEGVAVYRSLAAWRRRETDGATRTSRRDQDEQARPGRGGVTRTSRRDQDEEARPGRAGATRTSRRAR
jgi:hypothetical protein